MIDLLQRIMVYGFGVLFTLSLLVSTGFTFYLKNWIQCELTNYLYTNSNIDNMDCDSLRSNDQKISPFFFISWVLSCLIAIFAQIILSFHFKARKRAVILKQKTLEIITGAVSPTMDSTK